MKYHFSWSKVGVWYIFSLLLIGGGALVLPSASLAGNCDFGCIFNRESVQATHSVSCSSNQDCINACTGSGPDSCAGMYPARSSLGIAAGTCARGRTPDSVAEPRCLGLLPPPPLPAATPRSGSGTPRTSATTQPTPEAGGSTPGATTPAPANTDMTFTEAEAAAKTCSYRCRVGTGPVQVPPGATIVACESDADCATACSSGANSCSAKFPGTGSACVTQAGTGVTEADLPKCVPRPPSAPSTAEAPAPGGGPSATPSSGSGSGGSGSTLRNPLGETDLSKLIGRVIKAVVGVIGAVALLMFVVAGIMWMTSGGNDKNYKEAQEMMQNSAIGLLIIFFAYTIVATFFSLFGI
ncbi:MAG: hypothetical protein WCV84_03025 [Patescibacteria group bacterium]